MLRQIPACAENDFGYMPVGFPKSLIKPSNLPENIKQGRLKTNVSDGLV